MIVADLMTYPPVTITPSESIVAAAGNMRNRGTGILMVIDKGRLVGVLTDRDIVTRCVACGRSPQDSTVGEVMSREVKTCRDTQSIEEAAHVMGDHQVRRLPVNNAEGKTVGILSLSQIAEHYSEHLAGETLGEIVETRVHPSCGRAGGKRPCSPSTPIGR